MRVDSIGRFCILALVAALLVSPAVSWSQATTAPSSSKSPWEAIATSQDAGEIIAARERLIKDYQFAASESRGFAYAEEAAKKCQPALAADDPLAAVRQVNAAMAIAKMPQVSIQPALDAMVAHSNPAVRYLGWRAYHNIRMLLLAGGQRFAQQMLTSVETALAKEDSPVVLTALLEMAVYPATPPSTVSQQALSEAQNRTFAALAKNWSICGQLAMDGTVDATTAAGKAVEAAASLCDLTGRKEADKKAAAQVIVGLMWCATKVWVDSTDEQYADEAHQGLLREAEARLNALSGLNKRFIQKPIDDKDKELKAALRRGALEWLDALKEPLGVSEPKIEPRGQEPKAPGAPVAKPATKPATPKTGITTPPNTAVKAPPAPKKAPTPTPAKKVPTPAPAKKTTKK